VNGSTGHDALAVEPFIVAHRGASRDAPENTIPSFTLAWEQGADAIEGDFRLTRDGQIVCIHDRDTKRLAGQKKVVKDFTLDELKSLDVGSWFDMRFKETRIPTLSEVFSTRPQGKRVFIEIKCGPEILTRLLEEIRFSKVRREGVTVISFNRKVIHGLKVMAPHLKAIWISNFRRGKDGRFAPSIARVLKVLKMTHADGFSSFADAVVDGPFVAALREKGYECHVWTIDDLNTAKRFLGYGVASITTNVPGYLKANLFAQAQECSSR
jgi:glycerophosphoryl diester phosphodiesterase